MAKGLSRRTVIGTGAALVALPVLGTGATPPKPPRKLRARGTPERWMGAELKYIGMPVGGFFAGTLYLGGDGQLWNWDVFNQEKLGAVDRKPTTFLGDPLGALEGANYVDPVGQQSPFAQRWDLLANGRRIRFGQIGFRGEYPVAKLDYRAADADVEMDLVAFSPFCPLNVEDSSFPATTLTFEIRNTGKSRTSFTLRYRTENPVLAFSRKTRHDFDLQGLETETGGLAFSAAARKQPTSSRPDVLFTDWSSGTYGDWRTEGTAFGNGPQKVADLPSYMGSVSAGTTYVVNSHQTRNGEDVIQADNHQGRLSSPSFVIERDYVNLRVGGGNHAGTCVSVVVDGKVVGSVTGDQSNAMAWKSIEVRPYAGRSARIEVVDAVSGGWGQISLGEVVFSDFPRNQLPLEELPDYGSFCVEAIGGKGETEVKPESGEIRQTVILEPSASATLTLVVAWHFANAARSLPARRRWYGARWKDAAAVAGELRRRWTELRDVTLRWNRTWYDSTLPYWFLDRTFVNTSTLATSTCHRFEGGRFYFWEGIGCCPGSCTHVWGYAQAIGRLFPEVERYLRQEIDFGMAYRKDTGAIDYRAEYHQIVAVDGQCGCILRAYREHQMSRDDRFLRSIWPQVKGSMEYLMRQDPDRDGILDGAQYNTLDTAWYGKIAWISSLYLAALRATEAMARDIGDDATAAECARIAESGAKRMVRDLFNGEYFIHRVDESHPEANNTNDGCHIDQLYGGSWALQVGLPRVVPKRETVAALGALYRHNFYEDIWQYRRSMLAIPGGRWYAAPGEGGLLMCTFPRGGAERAAGRGNDAWAVGYFNECMSGFEYQAASHMIGEGLVDEGLSIVAAIHDRYAPSKRNPFNEVECSDHYGRAMASYGAYVAATGFRVDGPKDRMSHRPAWGGRLRCAFVNHRGWGTVVRTPDGQETVTYAYELPATGRGAD